MKSDESSFRASTRPYRFKESIIWIENFLGIKHGYVPRLHHVI